MRESLLLGAASACHLAAKALAAPRAAYRAAAFALTAAAGLLLQVQFQGRWSCVRCWYRRLTATWQTEARDAARLTAANLLARSPLCFRNILHFLAVSSVQMRSAATGGQSEPKLLLHVATELATVVVQAGGEAACAAAAAFCTTCAVLLLAAALLPFVVPQFNHTSCCRGRWTDLRR